MKFLKALLLVLIVLFPSKQLLAQIEGASESSSGSFYSLYGVGYPTDISSTRALGLGILGVSLDNSNSNSLQNPAMWGKNTLATASSRFNFTQFNNSNQNSNSTNTLFNAGYLQATFPISRGKVGFSASMYSVSRSNYRFVTFDSVATPDGQSVEYASDIRGNGGINKMELGFGWNINNNIAVGYAPSLTFVSQNNSRDVFFNQSGFANNNLDSKVTGTAIGHRLGALLNFRELLRKGDRVSVGLSATLPINIEAEENITVRKMVNNQDLEVSLKDPEKGTIKLPLELKYGLTYYPSGLVNFSVEGLYEQWSNYESPFDQDNVAANLSDRYKLGLGGEYHPYRTNSERFLSNFRYSAGVSYDTGHITMQNQDINTLWFSAGLGILSPRSNSSVDFSIRYGLRGTTKNNLVRENIWAFNLSVNLSELMFYRQKFN
jgi:hypothetical protein